MNINLDDKRIKKIIYQLKDGSLVGYNFNNGELWDVQCFSENCSPLKLDDELEEYEDPKEKNDPLLHHISNQIDDAKEIIEMDKNGKLDEILKKYGANNNKEPLSDKEMIDAVKKSEFMNEVNAARKRFKIGKEIVDGFPEKDDIYRENQKRSEDKCSDESLKVAQEIIKMDKEGKLDEIAVNSRPILDEKIKTAVKEYNSDLSYDSDICANSIRNIEDKVLIALRKGNKDELEKLMDDYKFYNERKKTIDNKIWNERFPISLDEAD
jgi:hypothetical protein